MVEPVGREAHDGVVHPVLHLQQGDTVGLVAHNLLHQRLCQSSLHGFVAGHYGRKLAVVACKDDAVGFADGNPAGGFQCLCRFVDEEGGKTVAEEQLAGSPCQRTGYDACLVEE